MNLIFKIEKEIDNLCTFLTESFSEQYDLNTNKYSSKQRLAKYSKYESTLKEVMARKAEKINSIRRNSLVFVY